MKKTMFWLGCYALVGLGCSFIAEAQETPSIKDQIKMYKAMTQEELEVTAQAVDLALMGKGKREDVQATQSNIPRGYPDPGRPDYRIHDYKDKPRSFHLGMSMGEEWFFSKEDRKKDDILYIYKDFCESGGYDDEEHKIRKADNYPAYFMNDQKV